MQGLAPYCGTDATKGEARQTVLAETSCSKLQQQARTCRAVGGGGEAHSPVECRREVHRAEVGNACQIALDLKYPMLIDSIDDDVERKYVASPIRLFVIDEGGIITYAGDQGPRGFDPDSWEAAIKKQTARVSA